MKRNSLKQILHTLAWKSFLTENEIMEVTFGYNRNTSGASNKKYADMLRRGIFALNYFFSYFFLIMI